MNKSLVQHGSDFAIVIDQSILEKLKVTTETQFALTTDGNSILMTPVDDQERQARLATSLEKINDRFGDDLERLAQ